jgi:hypothetical protein
MTEVIGIVAALATTKHEGSKNASWSGLWKHKLEEGTNVPNYSIKEGPTPNCLRTCFSPWSKQGHNYQYSF